MKLSDAIRKRIKYYLKIQDMKIWDLCKATGIPCSTISTFMSGKTEFFKDSIFDNTYQESNKD